MAWLKDFVGKVGEEYKKQVQLQQQQSQRESGYHGPGTNQGYQQGEYQRGSPSGWQQQYQQPQTQYKPQSPQYGQPQTPEYQPQQQQYPPPPSPYRPPSAQPSQTSSQPHITPPATQPAPQTYPQNPHPPHAHTQQLETQWREAERLAAHYKAQYEAQMKKATEDLANMRIEQEKQAQELDRLRAEEAKNYQLAEEELVREQQRLYDEIQKQRQEVDRPPLPPRINTDVEDAAPPLPRRPVSAAGTVSPAQRPLLYTAPPAQNSYLSPQSHKQVPSSPLQGYIPPPPPGPPPAQATTPVQPQSDQHVSPAVVSPGHTSQQTPYYPPPPQSSQAQPSPRIQEQASQRNSYHAPVPVSPQQQQASTPSYPPPPSVQSPPQRQPVVQSRPVSAPKPPRVKTPEPAQLHDCGAKAGLECSGSLTSFPQHWFYHAAVPEFVICARCYVDLIYDTKFRDSFRKVFYDDGHKRRCRFNTRRIKDTLLPEAVESGSLDKLVEFMKRRIIVKDCREQNITEGESWYKAADIPNGTICEACFEDGLITSSFAKYYQLLPNEGGAYCDLSVWFLKRKFMDYAKENKWAQFCQEFNQRAQIPECPKIDTINANERSWYKPINGPRDLQACAACYHDYFYASEDQDNWRQVAGGNFQTRCILGQLNHIIPMHQALDDEDRSLFWNAAWEMDKYPVCNREGTKGSSWYTPINDPPGWGICAACYEGIIKPIGGARWFMKDNSTKPDELYLCGFSLGHPRAVQALEAYVSARNWGDSKLFLDWTAQWGHVQQCPRKNFSKNRRWWGWGVLAICEDCYASFAKGTALEPRFALTGVREPEKERMCDIYSPRMRGLYAEACRTGDLEGLLAVGEQRHVVYTQTIMQCEQILNQQKIAAMQAQMLGTQGTFYKSMGWAQDATMGHSYTVGNSYAGYGHANEWVMQGYSYDRQSREAAAEVMSGGPLMRIQMLEARWREVE